MVSSALEASILGKYSKQLFEVVMHHKPSYLRKYWELPKKDKATLTRRPTLDVFTTE